MHCNALKCTLTYACCATQPLQCTAMLCKYSLKCTVLIAFLALRCTSYTPTHPLHQCMQCTPTRVFHFSTHELYSIQVFIAQCNACMQGSPIQVVEYIAEYNACMQGSPCPAPLVPRLISTLAHHLTFYFNWLHIFFKIWGFELGFGFFAKSKSHGAILISTQVHHLIFHTLAAAWFLSFLHVIFSGIKTNHNF